MTITLKASDLTDKYGFDDGILGVLGSDDHHKELIELVREHLLPLLDPNLEVYEIITSHNPIRAVEEWHEYCRECGISVEVEGYISHHDERSETWM